MNIEKSIRGIYLPNNAVKYNRIITQNIMDLHKPQGTVRHQH